MFKPKGEKEIRQEVIKDLQGDNKDFNADEYKEQIDRLTKTRLKDEKMKTSLHGQKGNQNNGRKHYKKMLDKNGIDPKTGKPKGDKKIKTETKDKDYITKDDLASFGKSQAHRNKYSWMKDDEYKLVKSESERTGKNFKEVMEKNSVIKSHFENVDIKKRQANAIGGPSNMVSQEGDEDKQTDLEKELDTDLPNGF